MKEGNQGPTPDNPATLFADHVLATAQADAIDSQRRLRLWQPLKTAAIIGGVTGIVAEHAASTSEVTLDASIAVATVASLGAVAFKKYISTPNDQKVGAVHYNNDTQAAVGQSYELYLVKGPKRAGIRKPWEVTMRWYGVHEQADPDRLDGVDHLTYIAALAKNSGVANIAIGDDLARQLCPSLSQAKVKMSSLLARSGLRAGGRAKTDTIHIKTPDEWLALVRNEGLAKGGSLEGLLQEIESIDRNHPLAQVWHEFKRNASSAAARAALLVAARKGVDRQLDSVEGSRPDYKTVTGQTPVKTTRKAPATDATPRKTIPIVKESQSPIVAKVKKEACAPVRPQTTSTPLPNPSKPQDPSTKRKWNVPPIFRGKYHVQGVINETGIKVHEFSNGQYRGTVDFDSALARMGQKGYVRLLETAVFKKLLDQKVVPQVEHAEPKPVVDSVRPYQPEILALKDRPVVGPEGSVHLRLRKVQRVGTFLVAAGIVGGLVGLCGATLDHLYNKATTQQAQAVAQERESKSQTINLNDPEVTARMGPWLAWQHIEDVNRATNETINFNAVEIKNASLPSVLGIDNLLDKDLNPNEAATADNISKMDSDRDNSQNYPDWNVTGVGMNTTGYWASSVANNLSYWSSEEGVMVRWEYDLEKDRKPMISFLPNKIDEGIGQHIAVTRQLAKGDMYAGPEGSVFVNIPVLAGARPIAVAFEGKSVRTLERTDGTFYIEIPPYHASPDDKTLKAKLQFWLGPSEYAPAPHRTLLTTIANENVQDDLASLDAAWERIIPGLPKATGDPEIDDTRSAMIANFMHTNWRYSLDPWNEDLMKGVDSLSEQAIRASRAGAAKCTTASSLIALENDNYTTVTGYLNGGDGSVLSAHEAHMWVVNDKGARLEGTPSQGISFEDAAYFAENYKGEGVPGYSNMWLYGELALVAGGLALWRRRNIRQLTKAAAGRLSSLGQQRLAKLSVDELSIAMALAEQAAYRPSVDITKAKARALDLRSNAHTTANARNEHAKEGKKITPVQLLVERSLGQNAGMQARSAKQVLLAASRQATIPNKATLRRAVSLTRRAQRIAKHRR